MTTIIPKYKILIAYDILPDQQEVYYRYILGEFVPALRLMGIHMVSAWHTAYGNYPERQVVFVAESWEVIEDAFANPRFKMLEDRLKTYTTGYERKVVAYAEHYQF